VLRRQAFRAGYLLLTIYWFVRRPAVEGVKCVLTDGDLVLLVRHTYGRHAWDLPGGTMRRGESPASAATREMHEELGLAIDHWVSLGDLFTTAFRRRDTIHCLRSELRGPAIAIDRGELEAAQWFRRTELPVDISRLVRPILTRA
jgi:8-oxo-dGTP diphosphatase